MLKTQTTADIIDKFELYLDDGTELSSADELDLANKKYQEVCSDRAWEFLKTQASGTIAVANGVATIPLPADFREFAINDEATDNTVGIDNNVAPKVIFVGSNYTPFQVVNFSDRRQFLKSQGYAYLDMVNNQIVFTSVPTTDTLAYEFDYIKIPADLTLVTAPIFPARFWDMIYHAMAVDDNIIQIQDRAHSYAAENQAAYMKYLKDLAFWNASLQNN